MQPSLIVCTNTGGLRVDLLFGCGLLLKTRVIGCLTYINCNARRHLAGNLAAIMQVSEGMAKTVCTVGLGRGLPHLHDGGQVAAGWWQALQLMYGKQTFTRRR
jgi:hypothetical protein